MPSNQSCRSTGATPNPIRRHNALEGGWVSKGPHPDPPPQAGEGVVGQYGKGRTRGTFQHGYQAGIAFAFAGALTGFREGPDSGRCACCRRDGAGPHPALPRKRGKESLRKLARERPHPPLLRGRGEPEFLALQRAERSDLDEVERRSMDLSLHLS